MTFNLLHSAVAISQTLSVFLKEMLNAVTRCLWSNPAAGRRMMSHHIPQNLSGKVAIVTASTDGYEALFPLLSNCSLVSDL